MKDTGIIRPIDNVGRVVIPKEVRETLNWLNGDQIEIHVSSEGVLLKKHEDRCLVCGTQFGLVRLGGHLFCRTCLKIGVES